MAVNIKSIIEKEEAIFVDFRFTDSKGKWQHITYFHEEVDQDLIDQGIMFDGSSIAGWKEIQDSDMMLEPDLDSYFVDPFASQITIIITCDVVEPNSREGYIRDPRTIAKKAEKYLIDSGIGDEVFFGPELEFFLFDNVRYKSDMSGSHALVESEESPFNSDKEFPEGNLAHRPNVKGGYFPVPPVDTTSDLRGEILMIMRQIGLTPTLHHHEVAACQNEVGLKFSTIVKSADNIQKTKYVVHNTAASYGKSATFMPKPVLGDNGSGMHVHQSIWKKGENLFSGPEYAGLSKKALHYIGGIIKHAKTINAFTNASTNSYKRLVPGFEAPVHLAFSANNRSASIRIPFSLSSKAKRIEARFPDASANPYYAFSAMLMAGIDGIKNEIDPGEAIEENLYNIIGSEKEKNIRKVASTLEEALIHLKKDNDFLKEGNVFTQDMIDAYIDLKNQDLDEYKQTPHPLEFRLYFSV